MPAYIYHGCVYECILIRKQQKIGHMGSCTNPIKQSPSKKRSNVSTDDSTIHLNHQLESGPSSLIVKSEVFESESKEKGVYVGSGCRVESNEGDEVNKVDDDIRKSKFATSKIYRKRQNESSSRKYAVMELSQAQQSQIKIEQDDGQNNGQTDNTRGDANKQKRKGLEIMQQQGSQEQCDSQLQMTIKQELGYSKIHMYNDDIAMQFTIPKLRAGPILVPALDYQLYLHDITS